MIVGNQRISASNQHVDSEIEFMSIHSQWVTDIFLSYYIVHDFATLFPIFILSFYPSFIRSIQYFKSITSATSPRYFRNILYRFHLLSFFVLITIHQLKERFTFSHIIQPESLREKRIFIKTFWVRHTSWVLLNTVYHQIFTSNNSITRKMIVHLEQTEQVFVIFMEIVEFYFLGKYNVPIYRNIVFPRIPITLVHIFTYIIRQQIITYLFDD